MISNSESLETPFGRLTLYGPNRAKVRRTNVPDDVAQACADGEAHGLFITNRWLSFDGAGVRARFHCEIDPSLGTVVTAENSPALLTLKLAQGDETAWVAVKTVHREWRDAAVTVEDISSLDNKFCIELGHPGNCVIIGVHMVYAPIPSNSPHEIPQWISNFSSSGQSHA